MPRVAVESAEIVRVELRHLEQLLDLSQSGALLACEAAFPVGTRGHFRAGLSGLPFGADI